MSLMKSLTLTSQLRSSATSWPFLVGGRQVVMVVVLLEQFDKVLDVEVLVLLAVVLFEVGR